MALAVAAAILGGGPAAGSAAAGQIVFAKSSGIWAMNEDGSGQRLLVGRSTVSGMENLLSPAVAPNGSAVAFTGETWAYQDTWSTVCGVVLCTMPVFGKYAHGIYLWQQGVTHRESPPAAPCSDCTMLDDDAEPRADGSFAWETYDCEGLGCVRRVYDKVREYPTCDGAQDPSPDPADAAKIVYAGCTSQNWPALIVTGPNRAGEVAIGCDDKQARDPSWSPSGTDVIDAEDGTDPGLGLYRPGTTSCQTGWSRYVLIQPPNVTFSSPRYVGNDTIVFAAGKNLWTIPASCDRCAFPGAAKQLTTDGDSSSPAWTADPLVVPPSGGGTGGTGGAGGTTTGPTDNHTNNPPQPPAPADTTAPKLAIQVKAAQRPLKQRDAIVLSLTADEAAQLAIETRIAIGGKTLVVPRFSTNLLPGLAGRVRIRLSAKTCAKLRAAWRRHKRPVATLRLSARDLAGNIAMTRKQIALRR